MQIQFTLNGVIAVAQFAHHAPLHAIARVRQVLGAIQRIRVAIVLHSIDHDSLFVELGLSGPGGRAFGVGANAVVDHRFDFADSCTKQGEIVGWVG
jgi:hypothetical protein